jgi:uncharacterized membrane protein YphA (DoxX/SURF4 family)
LSLYSVFPRGRVGAGLLFLRTTLGVVMLARGLLLADSPSIAAGATPTAIFGLVAGALLIIGLLTPIASLVVAAASAGAWVLSSSIVPAGLFDSGVAALLAGAIAFALVLLGPGAFSADARLFGPREILIPSAPDPRDR